MSTILPSNGHDNTIIDELDVLSRIEQPQPVRRWLTEDEVDQISPPTWLVNGVIPLGEVTMIAGPGDAGKTFLVVDITKRVAQHYPTMYVAAEDASGIKIRKRAWELHHGIPKNGNFLMWDGALSLTETQEVDQFINEVRSLGLKMIVIDTLSQSITGADENSASDMSVVMHNCQRIAHELGAAVVIIHHTTKDGSNYRGSSVMKNNTYGFLEVIREDDLIRFECVRIKNTKPFQPRFFRLVEVTTNILDQAGIAVQSCIIAAANRVIRTGDELTSTRRKMLETLEMMTDAQGGAKTTELQSALGLNGNSFYGPLKELRKLGLVEKGERHTAPIKITDKGRERLAAILDTDETQLSSASAEATPFEVNTLLGQMLPKLPGSNFGSSNSGSNCNGSASYHSATSEKARGNGLTTNATKMLPNTTGSNGVTTTTTPGSLDREVGSNSGRTNERKQGGAS